MMRVRPLRSVHVVGGARRLVTDRHGETGLDRLETKHLSRFESNDLGFADLTSIAGR